jgi:hypothetical protein
MTVETAAEAFLLRLILMILSLVEELAVWVRLTLLELIADLVRLTLTETADNADGVAEPYVTFMAVGLALTVGIDVELLLDVKRLGGGVLDEDETRLAMTVAVKLPLAL